MRGVTFLALFCAVSAHAAPGDVSALQPPCNLDETSTSAAFKDFLRPCSQVILGKKGATPEIQKKGYVPSTAKHWKTGLPLEPGILPAFDAQMEHVFERLYAGERLSTQSTTGKHFGAPVCDIQPWSTEMQNRFHPKAAEVSLNFKNETCGKTLDAKFVFDFPAASGPYRCNLTNAKDANCSSTTFGGKCGGADDTNGQCIRDGCKTQLGITGGDPLIDGLMKKGTRQIVMSAMPANLNAPKTDYPGAREAAWQRGAFARALGCFYERNRAFLATPPHKLPSLDSNCAAMGKMNNQLYVQGNTAARTVAKTDGQDSATTDAALHGQVKQNSAQSIAQSGASEIHSCLDTDWLAGDSGHARQEAQQLCAARLSSEGIFAGALMCDTVWRAKKAYERNFVNYSLSNQLEIAMTPSPPGSLTPTTFDPAAGPKPGEIYDVCWAKLSLIFSNSGTGSAAARTPADYPACPGGFVPRPSTCTPNPGGGSTCESPYTSVAANIRDYNGDGACDGGDQALYQKVIAGQIQVKTFSSLCASECGTTSSVCGQSGVADGIDAAKCAACATQLGSQELQSCYDTEVQKFFERRIEKWNYAAHPDCGEPP